MAITPKPSASDLDDTAMEDQEIPSATTPSSPTKDNDTENMEGQEIPMAIIADPPANDNGTEDPEDQQILYIHPQYLQLQASSNTDISRPKSSSSSEAFFTPPSSPPIDWDEIDPRTGLSKACSMACQIIDNNIDCNVLRRFYAPRFDNPSLETRQLVEMFLDGGESEQRPRKRMAEEYVEMVKQRHASVADKVAGIVAAWKGRAVSMKMVKKMGMKAGKGGM